jgi:hypothetical protein
MTKLQVSIEGSPNIVYQAQYRYGQGITAHLVSNFD